MDSNDDWRQTDLVAALRGPADADVSYRRTAASSRQSMKSARDEFRKAAAEALADWRLGCIPPRPDSSFERAIFIAGLAEILRLRLCIAYTPLLTGLQRIEDRVNILATMREDPYAPPKAHARPRISVR